MLFLKFCQMSSIIKQYCFLSIWIFSFLIFSCGSLFGSISICSWNLENFGHSKSDVELSFVASTIQSYDVIAIQEIVAGSGGVQAVARLVDIMNRKGGGWDYSTSNPTSGSGYQSERYAFIWNKKLIVKIGKAWLDQRYALEIDREPYMGTFRKEGKMFTIVNFHAKPKSKQPETDIKYFKFIPTIYPDLNLIFCGDFNCPQSNTVFNPLKKMGYKPAFVGQKTTLRMKPIQNECLASEYDNFFYSSKKTSLIKSGVIRFDLNFKTLVQARTISDHLPIYMRFN